MYLINPDFIKEVFIIFPDIPKYLKKVFPNPISGSTSFEWTLTEPCEVRIQLMDITGKPVATLVNNNQQAGEYKMEYNASGLGPGIYFCHFSAGNICRTQKLVVVK